MTVFIKRAQVEDNAAMECIRTIAAKYGCKILALYEYEANEYGYEAKCKLYAKKHKRQKIIESKPFCIV